MDSFLIDTLGYKIAALAPASHCNIPKLGQWGRHRMSLKVVLIRNEICLDLHFIKMYLWSYITDLFQKTPQGGRVMMAYIRESQGRQTWGEESGEENGRGHCVPSREGTRAAAAGRTPQRVPPSTPDASSGLVALPGCLCLVPTAGSAPDFRAACD